MAAPAAQHGRAPKAKKKGKTAGSSAKGASPKAATVGGSFPTRKEWCPDDSEYAQLAPGQSANHLLNFTFVDEPNTSRGGDGRGRSRGSRGGGRSAGDVFARERFVQSNYRLACTRLPDTASSLGPDYVVPWADVAAVICIEYAPRSACPICLDVPVAPRMPPCGHIFCCACVRAFLASVTEPYKPCPVCTEHVALRDLRPVLLSELARLVPGDEAEFVLMRRPRASVLPVLARQYDPSCALAFPLASRDTAHSPLLLADAEFMAPLLAAEAAALADARRLALSSGEDSQVVHFDAAIADAASAEARWRSAGGVVVMGDEGSSAAVAGAAPSPPLQPFQARALRGQAARQSDSGDLDPAGSDCFFYREAHGRALYVDASLHHAAFASEWGADPAAWPVALAVPLVFCEEQRLGAAARVNQRALAHLPLSASVAFAEVDASGLLSGAVAKRCDEEARARARARAARQRKSEAASARAGQRLDASWRAPLASTERRPAPESYALEDFGPPLVAATAGLSTVAEAAPRLERSFTDALAGAPARGDEAFPTLGGTPPPSPAAAAGAWAILSPAQRAAPPPVWGRPAGEAGLTKKKKGVLLSNASARRA